MAEAKTNLGRMEEKAEQMFGGPRPFGMVDHSMLEMTDTNRWIFDKRQSELSLAWLMLHDALVSADNRTPRYKKVQNSQTGEWHSERIIVDNWRWMLEIDYRIRTNQLTIGAFSRFQHLRQTASMFPIAHEDEQPSFWDRLFGRG